MNNSNAIIGQYELIIKELMESKKIDINERMNISNKFNNTNNNFKDYKESKIKELGILNNTSNDYNNKIMKNYIGWIDIVRSILINKINENNLYSFFKFDGISYNLYSMEDYYDVPDTEKLFSFSLFISDPNNLTYLIGLVYNYSIIRKHFSNYKMRIYIDFHSVFGSPETFNIFNMFIDILREIDPQFMNNIQMIVFFLNPFYIIDVDSIYDNLISDIDEVKQYYDDILYNINADYRLSPLLNMKLKEQYNSESEKINVENKVNIENKVNVENKNNKKKVVVDIENLEIKYNNIDTPTSKSTFALFSSHLSVSLRFLPMNENCEFHVRDLDSRLSLTDINIINKFNNPKYQYVPYYVFQFYKFYFPYLKWRIDVNPYLAGCFGGNNRKNIMISKELQESDKLKILKKELFFKYILFISFNAANLQISFINDEFILANIFEKIKGDFSENILFLNLGSFANKHVNEYYYGLNDSSNYPCMLKLGIPIDILTYPLNGKYLTIDPITDFKIGTIPIKFHNQIKNLILEQLKHYLGLIKKEKNILANKIRINYKSRLDDEINNDLEAALFFSMIPQSYTINGVNEFNLENYTSNSFSNQFFSSIGSSTNLIKNNKLKATNFMLAGYLLSDILEDIIFPNNPEYINSNYYLSNDNYDRLFNCLYFDEKNKKFVHRKINKKDISRKYIDQNIINNIPRKFLEFDNKEDVINLLNNEFNEYLKTSSYYPSMHWYIEQMEFNKFIQVDNKLIKSGILLFIKNYDNPIYDINGEIINNININDVKSLKYDLSSNKNSINGISINKNKLKYNLLFIDDKNINQLTYHNSNNNSTVNVKLLQSTHINNLEKYIKNNKYSDFLIVNNI